MKRSLFRVGVGLVQVLALCAGGSALAGGGSSASDGAGGAVQVTYRCQGGVRVQVTPTSDKAQVEFAGQSLTLNLVPGSGGKRYQNNEFTWFTQGKTSSMKRNAGGRLALSGCTPLKPGSS